MHAGYPFLDNTIALMKVYTHIYADLSRMNWHSATRTAFHNYLKALIDAGFEDRLMFGSDAAGHPEAIGLAIEGIESAEFLTKDQKADIFYNNAARFLRLSDEQIARHYEQIKATNKR
jgi:predicted TIM-barrel fold metal-dependent hydrolase